MQEYLWEHAYTSEVKTDHWHLGLCVLANHLMLAELIIGPLIPTQIHLLLIRFQNQNYVMIPFSWAITSLCFLCSWYPNNHPLHEAHHVCTGFPSWHWKQNWHIRKLAASSMMLYLPSLGHDLSWACFSAMGKLARSLYPQLFQYCTFSFAQ